MSERGTSSFYSRPRQHPYTRQWQDVLNDAGARHPEHECDPPIPVTVRIVWERDGTEYLRTVALGWTGRLAYVQMFDRRCATKALWLRAEDVTRR